MLPGADRGRRRGRGRAAAPGLREGAGSHGRQTVPLHAAEPGAPPLVRARGPVERRRWRLQLPEPATFTQTRAAAVRAQGLSYAISLAARIPERTAPSMKPWNATEVGSPAKWILPS